MTIDPSTFRLVVGGLVGALLLDLVLLGAIAIVGVVVGHQVDYPGVLDDVYKSLVPGLLGLLINARNEEPVDVKVTNAPASPVPTSDVEPKRKSRTR